MPSHILGNTLITYSRRELSETDDVTVEVHTWPITYVYSMSDLLITYGVAFLCALTSTIAGLFAFFSNGSSYQNLFSTYFRATCNLNIHSYVEPGDDGADPLPHGLARSRIPIMGRESLATQEMDCGEASSMRCESVSPTSLQQEREDSEPVADSLDSRDDDHGDADRQAGETRRSSQEVSNSSHSREPPTEQRLPL